MPEAPEGVHDGKGGAGRSGIIFPAAASQPVTAAKDYYMAEGMFHEKGHQAAEQVCSYNEASAG